METVDIREADSQLSQLVDQALADGEVIVSRDGKALVRIKRLVEPKRKIIFGRLDGKIKIPDDFDAPLPDDVLASFEGR